MKKLLILFITLFLVACETEQPQEPAVETPVVETPVTETPVVETPETEVEQTIEEKIPMPELPDMDFTDLDFFDDGYQIVELVSCTDGDTAVFKINGMSQPTRFLAIDTPETSNGVDPWGFAAKDYTCNALQNAEQIILENDEESDVWDNYNRLLAFIWVDGEMLQYNLVRESLAYVKYLYGDYKHNPTLIGLEVLVQKEKAKIWGELDPDFNYDDEIKEINLGELKDINTGNDVIVEGIITGVVGNNAFIQDEFGAVYIYTNNRPYSAIIAGVGTEVRLTASKTIYNGLTELSNIKDNTIEILSEGNPIPDPVELTLGEVAETWEGYLVTVTQVTVLEIDPDSDSKGYNVVVEKDGLQGVIRVDKYLDPFIEQDLFTIGQVIDVVANVGQFNDTYQLMIRTEDDIK
jgi:micrococcal nuclease